MGADIFVFVTSMHMRTAVAVATLAERQTRRQQWRKRVFSLVQEAKWKWYVWEIVCKRVLIKWNYIWVLILNALFQKMEDIGNFFLTCQNWICDAGIIMIDLTWRWEWHFVFIQAFAVYIVSKYNYITPSKHQNTAQYIIWHCYIWIIWCSFSVMYRYRSLVQFFGADFVNDAAPDKEEKREQSWLTR